MRKLLFVIATILIFRYIFRLLAHTQKSKQEKKKNKEGSVSVKYTPNKDNSTNKKHGEYVDFEEVE